LTVIKALESDTLVKTSTSVAPWNLIEGNDKCWARVRVLAKLVKILSTALQYEPFDPLQRKAKIEKGEG